MAGIAVFSVASWLCAQSTDLLALSSARALQGLGGACIMSVNTALIRFIYPSRIIGRGIALNGLVVAAGTALGPTLASAVLSVASWQWLFLINVPLGGLGLMFAWKFLPDTPRHHHRFDIVAASLNAFAFGGLIVGLDRLAHGDGVAASLGLIIGGALCLGLLFKREASEANPLFPIDLLKFAHFRAAFMTGFLSFLASNLFMVSMPFTLEIVLHRSAVSTGLLMTPWPVAIVLIAPMVGRLSDRFSAAILSTIGLALVSLGFLAVWLLPPTPTAIDIIWRIALAGAGFGLFQPPNNRAMLMAAPIERAGGTSGMISMARLLGQTSGAISVVAVFEQVAVKPSTTCVILASCVALAAACVSAFRLTSRAYIIPCA